jgi:ferredoxin
VNVVNPPKSFFFLRRETLFVIEGTKQPKLTQPAREKPVAIFGLRSCDAEGIRFLDRFFREREFNDNTVTERIESSLRMTLACHQPGPDCFCVCCEGGPFLTKGYDIQFVDLGDTLLAEVGTEKGAAVILKMGDLFTPAEATHLEAKRRLVDAVDIQFKRRSYMSDGTKRISLNKVPKEVWQSLAGDCQACGGCCYVCPTCSCFTVNDVPVRENVYERERLWDACLYSGFTREASGHNPRHSGADRLNRRFFHKMSFHYIQRMGRHGCVGCGRCVTTCMGGLDISNLLVRMKDACNEYLHAAAHKD